MNKSCYCCLPGTVTGNKPDSQRSQMYYLLSTLSFINIGSLLIWNFLWDCHVIIMYNVIMYNAVLLINLLRQHTNHTATCYGNTTMQNRGVFVSIIGIVSFVTVYLLFSVLYWLCPIESKFLPDYSGFKAYYRKPLPIRKVKELQFCFIMWDIPTASQNFLLSLCLFFWLLESIYIHIYIF